MADLNLGLRLNFTDNGAASGLRTINAELNRTNAANLGTVNASLRQMGGSLNGLSNQFAALAVAAAGAFSIASIVKAADTWASLEGRLKLATSSTEAMRDAQAQLFAVSNTNRSNLESTIELYAKIARNQKELNMSTQQMIGLTDTVGKTLIISGSSAESASQALIQFSQSMSSGILNGEEYRSVAEQAPRLLRAIAEGWKNADGSIGISAGKLRALALDQQLTMSDKVLPAIQRASKLIGYEFSQMPLTVGQALTVAENHLLKFVGVTGQTSGAAGALAESIIYLGEHVEPITASVLSAAGAWLTYQAAVMGVSFVSLIGSISTAIALNVAHSEALAMNAVIAKESALTEANAYAATITASQARVAADIAAADANLTLAASNAALVQSDYASVQSTLSANAARMTLLRSQIAAAATLGYATTATVELTAAQQAHAASIAELTALGQMQAATQTSITTETNTLSAAQARSAALAEVQIGAQSQVAIATAGVASAQTALAASTTLTARAYALLGSIIPALRAELTALNLVAKANPYAVVITALVAAGTALYLYRDKLISVNGTQAELRDYAKVAWDEVSGFIKTAWDTVASYINPIIDGIKDKIAGLIPDWLGKMGTDLLGLAKGWSDAAAAMKKTRDEADALAKQKDLSFKLGLQPKEVQGLNFNKAGDTLVASYNDDYKKATLSARELELEKIKLSGATGKEYDFLINLLDKKLAAEKTTTKETKKELKSVGDLAKAVNDERIADIKRLTDASLRGLEQQKTANDNQYADGKISALEHYKYEITLIDQVTKAKIAALQQQKAAQTDAFNSQISDMDKLHAALLQHESRGDLTAVNKTSGALGGMQVLASTLRNPGYGVTPFQPAIDQNISRYNNYDTLKSFATKYQAELKTFGETYFDALVQNLDSVDAAIQQYGNHTKAYKDDILRMYAGIAGQTTESIKLAGNQKDAEQQITAAISDGEQAKASALRTYQQADATYEQSVDQLKLKYTELTGTLRDAFLAKQALERKNNPLIKPETLGLINNTAKAELANFDQKSAEDFNAKLLEINQSYAQIGLTSTQAFDLMNKGAGGVVQAFGSLTDALVTVDDAINKNSLAAKKDANDHSLSETQKASLASAYAKKGIALEREKTTTSLTGMRQIVGATGQMFGENTKARKAFHVVEMALGGIEMAYNLTVNASKIASNLATMGSSIAAAAATIWSQMGIFAPIGLAVMAASLAAWGAGAFGGGSAPIVKSSPTTGTVLGDTSASSESIANISTLLKDVHASEYKELRGINAGVANLQNALVNVVTTIFRSGGLDSLGQNTNRPYTLMDNLTAKFTSLPGLIATGVNTAIGVGIGALTTSVITAASGAAVYGGAAAGLLSGLGIGSMAGPIGIAAGLLWSGLTAMFSGGYADNKFKQGIQVPQQTLSNLSNGQFDANYSNTTKIRSWGLFWDDTKFVDQLLPLNEKIKSALGTMFKSASSLMIALAGKVDVDLQNKVKNYVMPELNIDLTKLSAEDASKKLNAVMSTALDTMSETLFGSIFGKYQALGEGMLQTVSRVLTEQAVVVETLRAQGVAVKSNGMALSQSLISIFGSLKDFQESTDTYYNKFLSDTERQALLKKSLLSQFADINTVLPNTRDGFKTLVKSMDMANQKDQTRWTVLMRVSDAADQYYSALEGSIQTYDNIAKYLDSLKLNKELTTLNPAQRLNESRQQFITTLVSAKQGNGKAADSLPSVADAYLKEAGSFFAHTKQYQAILTNVTGSLEPFRSKDTAPVINGSHANGLERVPFDGYIARLHQGERVQTKSQAQAVDNDNGAALAELRENNRLLREQNARLEQLIRVSQFGFKGVINAEENVASALDDLEQRLWKTEAA